MELSQALGYIATILFSIMYLPQIVKTLRIKSVKEISLPMFILGFIANIIALWYAILINQTPLIVKYTIALGVLGIYIIIYLKLRGRK